MNRRKFLESGAVAGMAAVFVNKPTLAATSSEVSLPIRLNANENALGLAPSARKAVTKGILSANRYPFLEAQELSMELTELHKVPDECLLLGNGSSEILRLVVQVTENKKPTAITADPTYESIGQQSKAYSLPIHRIPLRADWAHDFEKMNEAADQVKGPVLVYICNPNNPTGTLTPSREVLAWINQAPGHFYFIVDEAYHHYVESSQYFSLATEAPKRKNLLVARTFSKIYAMAGLRIGYGIASAEMIERMQQFTRLNINTLAITSALASIQDASFLEKSFESNKESKRLLYRTLEQLDIEFLDSQTNFVMHRIKGDLETYNERMRSEGIYTGREFPPMTNYSRVSLGLPEETAFFCGKLKMFREKGWI